ncbi:hypothetical protein Goari_014760 [Gossypium aridum]|uniref:DUF4283 domain-containing protein n=1 Tax=Gossypium aridum TaxID=34290 RepID=A0A7J8XIS0_GOSAI|nr:hypothetical protein [Gossypium aridum]
MKVCLLEFSMLRTLSSCSYVHRAWFLWILIGKGQMGFGFLVWWCFVSCTKWRGIVLPRMAEDINVLLERLNFSEEEWIRVISSNVKSSKIQGYEAWAVEKIMSGEKFGIIEDRTRILKLPPWLFDQCLFAMLPYVKDQDLDTYALNISPFWLRIFNIPLEYMDKQVAIDVGKAIGEFVAIDWRDNDGKWTKYIRVRVKIDVLKPLPKVRFAIYAGSSITTQKRDKKEEQNEQNLQYGIWLRASVRGSTQARSNWRNGIEVIEEKKAMKKDSNND